MESSASGSRSRGFRRVLESWAMPTRPLAQPCSPWSGRALGIFRIVAGLIFVSAGTTKVFAWPPTPGGMPPVDPLSQMGIGGLLEIVGGLAITIGIVTRPVAFVLAGEMAVAYFQFHAPLSPFPTVNQGIPAILYCFFYVYLAFAGAGTWSVDARMARSRTSRHSNEHTRQQSPPTADAKPNDSPNRVFRDA